MVYDRCMITALKINHDQHDVARTQESTSHPNHQKMARNIEPWQRKMIAHMICSKQRLTTSQIAKAAKCSERSVTNICKKMRLYGSARSPPICVGRPSTITPVMLDALREHLVEKPDLYVEEMVAFLRDEFGISTSPSSLKRALSGAGWTRKKAQQKAKEQSPELRDFYQHKLSQFRSYQLVFVDESGCDKRVGYRRSGWAPSV